MLDASAHGWEDLAVVGVPEPVVCWSCRQQSTDVETCAWCGVWLADLDPRQVPPAARPLLPLARRWGIGDDGYRSTAIEHADRTELEAIVQAVSDDANDEVDRWLIGPEADAPAPSREYVAITCLIMAADHARLRLRKQHSAASA